MVIAGQVGENFIHACRIFGALTFELEKSELHPWGLKTDCHFFLLSSGCVYVLYCSIW